jgi:hypothetical protein
MMLMTKSCSVIGQSLLKRTSLTRSASSGIPSRCHRLWVDALCVNQDDRVEQSQQVAMMAAIYAKALRVLVWLGKDDETSTGAIALTFSHAVCKRPTFSALIDRARKISGTSGFF